MNESQQIAYREAHDRFVRDTIDSVQFISHLVAAGINEGLITLALLSALAEKMERAGLFK